MKTLVLDTSTNLLYISFIVDNKVIYEVKSIGLNNHSDYLLDLIEKGLKENNLQVKDFDRILLGKGPGAYTGLRVSMSVAKMFSWTLNIPLYVISSLDLLSSGYYKENATYAIMIKAKKDYSYTKRIKVVDGKIEVLRKEEFMFNEDFLKECSESDIVINNDNIKIDYLNIDESSKVIVENVHALEPNYLRTDI